ncbi:MAG: hypothetical protein ACRD8Z_18810 [Nitrososphaeraceae archaeon]
MNVNRYLMVLAIGTGMIAISLLLFRIPIVALWELMLVSVSLIMIWVYYDWREKKKIEAKEIRDKIQIEKCWCHVCRHTEARDCIKVNCTCCLLIKKNQILGHEPG